MTVGERRRVRVLFLGLGCVPVFLAGWFGWVQVLQAGALPRVGKKPVPLSAASADAQRDRSEVLPGARGTIVDRHGAVLAMDCDSYEVRAEVRPPRDAWAGRDALANYCANLSRRLADALTRDESLSDRAEARREHLSRLSRRLYAEFAFDSLPATGKVPDTAKKSAEILVAADVSVMTVIEALDELDAGFVEEAGRGSHRVFVHAQLRQFRVTLVERRGTMLPEYVADTLAAIDAVRTLARSGEPGDEIR